jgi:hypothetical protein
MSDTSSLIAVPLGEARDGVADQSIPAGAGSMAEWRQPTVTRMPIKRTLNSSGGGSDACCLGHTSV